jgi:hypothetical protein
MVNEMINEIVNAMMNEMMSGSKCCAPYSTTTAVPLMLTISIPFPCPSTS